MSDMDPDNGKPGWKSLGGEAGMSDDRILPGTFGEVLILEQIETITRLRSDLAAAEEREAGLLALLDEGIFFLKRMVLGPWERDVRGWFNKVDAVLNEVGRRG